MKVILGLGNPGVRFKFTRHNLGFLVVEKLAKANKIKINQRVLHCLLGKGSIKGQQVLLGTPLTFMNLSGEAVFEVVRQKKLGLKDLLIICDDINLPLGKIRIRAKGSDGGHKGLRSIIDALGTQAFARLRFGVGKEKAKKDKLSSYVLSRFNRKEIKIINETIEMAAQASELWAKEGIVSAMNRFNQKGD